MQFNLKTFIKFLSIFTITLNAFALEPTLHFRHINSENGLPQNSVWDLIQDDQGFIWIGTSAGLGRYDGYKVKTFLPKQNSPTSISGKAISSLLQDKRGNIWIGTRDAGLNRYDPKTEKFTQFRHIAGDPFSLQNEDVREITEGYHGNIWLGSTDGLYKLDPHTGKFTHYSNPLRDRRANFVTKIIVPDERTLILATARGAFYFDTETETFESLEARLALKQDFSGYSIYSMLLDKEHNLWLGTIANGLFMYSHNNKVLKHYQKNEISGISSHFVRDIVQGSSGELWLATKDGLNKFIPDTEKFIHINHSPTNPLSLKNDFLSKVLIDDSNNLWVGSNNAGVSIHSLKSQYFKHYLDNNDACLYKVTTDVLMDGELMWTSSEKGIFSFNRQTGECRQYINTKLKPDLLTGNVVTNIAKEQDGTLWFGSLRGLNRLPAGSDSFEHYRYNPNDENGLDSDYVYSTFVDSKNRLWVGSLNGLSLYNPKSNNFTHYRGNTKKLNIQDSLKVIAIAEGNEDTLWVGGLYGFYLFDLKSKSFTKYRHYPKEQEGPSLHIVSAIHPDGQGNLWLATRQGLKRFELASKSFKHYGLAEGLPSEFIRGVNSDSTGNIWVSTNKGLSRLSPHTGQVTNFTTEDGLQGLEFGDGSFYSPANDELFFSGANGLNSFYPLQLRPDKVTSKTLLTDFLINNHSIPVAENNDTFSLTESISYANTLTLPYEQASFSIEFSSTNYVSPKHNQYQYKMQGFGADWITTDSLNRRATYTQLPAGNYTFYARSRYKQGEWGESVSIQIKVLPPWWQTWQAYLGYFLLLSACIYTLVKLRTRQLHKKAKQLKIAVETRTQELSQRESELREKNQQVSTLLSQKKRMFSNVSHEFRTPLTLIISPIQHMLKSEESAQKRKQLSIIERNSQQLHSLVEKMLELAHLESPENWQYASYSIRQSLNLLQDSFSTALAHKHIHLQITCERDLQLYLLKDSLDQILINLLANAIKYTPERGAISIEVYEKANFAEINVIDNGIGINKQDQQRVFKRFTRVENKHREYVPGSGIGLALVKELVEANKGQISLQSEVNLGCKFKVRLPISTSTEQVLTTEIIDSERRLTNFSTQLPLPKELVETEQDLHENSYKPLMLFIEDNQDMQTFLASSFQQHFQCLSAYDGESGLAQAIEHIPDFIICDVMMPGIDGYSVAKRLRDDARTCHIPILMLTAKGDVESRMHGWKQNVDEYITKPFNPEELHYRVQNILSIRQIIKQRLGRQLSVNSPDASTSFANINHKDQAFIKKFETIIAEHYPREGFNRSDAAELMALSERQLNRKLSSLIDHNFSEYLRKYRLRKAISLMGKGLQVAQISDAVGFASTNYFSRCFKAEYSLTVTEYEQNTLASLAQQE